MKTAIVTFPTSISTAYHFITDIDLVVGDKVVCDTARGLVVGSVFHVEDTITDKAKAWIVDKVDMVNHKKRVELDEKKKALKKRMDARRKKLEDIEVFALLAKNDDEMANLLVEYNELVKSCGN